MDVEQLKMITETIVSLGNNGESAFIWYLVLDKLVPVLGWLVFGVTLLVACVKVARLISKHQSQEEAFKSFRDQLGCGSGWLDEREFIRTRDKIQELINIYRGKV